MAVKINTSSQAESKEELLPLAGTFYKKNKLAKEYVFACNSVRLSKSEEWLICEVIAFIKPDENFPEGLKTRFVTLISAESKQAETLVALIAHCREKSTALICMYNKDLKSKMAFGEDDECEVIWRRDEEESEDRYAFKSLNNPYCSTAPIGPSKDEAPKVVGRTKQQASK